MDSGSLTTDKKSVLIDSSRGALYCTYIVAKPEYQERINLVQYY